MTRAPGVQPLLDHDANGHSPMPKLTSFLHNVACHADAGMKPHLTIIVPWFMAAYFVAPLLIEPTYVFVF